LLAGSELNVVRQAAKLTGLIDARGKKRGGQGAEVAMRLLLPIE
jgi:hypothetical protein